LHIPRSRKISAVALFAALTIVLNLTVRIPAPYATFLIYEVWEVPILAAFLIFGAWVGILVAIVNLLSLIVIFPGIILTGPLYNLAAILATMLGIYLLHRTLTSAKKRVKVVVIGTTLFGALSRVLIMTIVNGLFLPMSPPIGFNVPFSALPNLLILIAIFNASLALYTIPLAYSILKAVASRYRLAVAYSIDDTSLVKT
jgi:riboflavin transporter FmnP